MNPAEVNPLVDELEVIQARIPGLRAEARVQAAAGNTNARNRNLRTVKRLVQKSRFKHNSAEVVIPA